MSNLTKPTKKFYHFSRAVTIGEYYTILAENEDEARNKLDAYEEKENYDTHVVEKSDYFHLDAVDDDVKEVIQ
tara:strand:+ start:2812 stop:3030 length:219 start_codon:yes stop_codon:yes gene_type:complete